MNWYNRFFSQPHQSFFSSGVLFFIIFIFLLFLNYSNIYIFEKSMIEYHVYPLIFIVFMQFFLGFLFTVFPRFLALEAIKKEVYIKQFFAYFISSVFFILFLFLNSSSFIIFQIVLFITQVFSFMTLYKIHKNSKIELKDDSKYILIALAWGLVSHLCFIVYSFSSIYIFLELAINIGIYLFLLLLIFSVSQRMIPFFTRAKIPTYIINKSKNLLITFHILLVIKVLLINLEIDSLNLIINLLLFVFTFQELYKWKLPIFKAPSILWVLHLALFYLPFSFFISFLEELNNVLELGFIFEKASLHTLVLGYFVTVLLGFGTRVVLGHSNQTPHANKYTISIFILAQVFVFFRLFSSFALNFNFNYTLLISLSALLLLTVLILWSIKYLVIILRIK